MCLYCTVFRGEEWGLGSRCVFRPGGHQLYRSHMFISQLPQTSLAVLDHLLHYCMLLKCFDYLSLRERQTQGSFGAYKIEKLHRCKK